MSKSHIDISSILLIVVLFNFVTYAVNARILASKSLTTYKFTNFNEGIKDSGPSSGGRGHDDSRIAQKFNWAGIDDSGPSPGGRGHNEPPPAQSFDWFVVKHSSLSHDGKGHNEPPSTHNIDWIDVKDSGPSHGGKGHDGTPTLY